MLCELSGFVHDLANFSIHNLECCLVDKPGIEQALAQVIYRITLVAIFIDLFLGPVLRRITH